MASAPRNEFPSDEEYGNQYPANEVPADGVVVPEEAPQQVEPEPVAPAAQKTDDKLPVTRLARIWTAIVIGLVLLVLLIIFIAQNQDQVTLRYFAYEGQANLGLALFIAAVGGGLLTAAAGAARIIQLRTTAHRRRKAQGRR